MYPKPYSIYLKETIGSLLLSYGNKVLHCLGGSIWGLPFSEAPTSKILSAHSEAFSLVLV